MPESGKRRASRSRTPPAFVTRSTPRRGTRRLDPRAVDAVVVARFGDRLRLGPAAGRAFIRHRPRPLTGGAQRDRTAVPCMAVRGNRTGLPRRTALVPARTLFLTLRRTGRRDGLKPLAIVVPRRGDGRHGGDEVTAHRTSGIAVIPGRRARRVPAFHIGSGVDRHGPRMREPAAVARMYEAIGTAAVDAGECERTARRRIGIGRLAALGTDGGHCVVDVP